MTMGFRKHLPARKTGSHQPGSVWQLTITFYHNIKRQWRLLLAGHGMKQQIDVFYYYLGQGEELPENETETHNRK